MNPNPPAALHALVDQVYGPLAPAPAQVTSELRHRAVVARWGNAALESWRVSWGGRLGDGFSLMLMRPAEAAAPCPVLVTGDACWAYWMVDDVIAAAARSGVALAWFNRTDVHADPAPEDRAAIEALVAQPPGGMAAMAAWAWATQRAVDALTTMPGIDPSRIGAAGHSRGGKAALLAGALDARIALVAANNSGALGAASSFDAGPGAETVAELAHRFPHWVGPRLRDAVAHGNGPSADQDVLLAAIAPRRLVVTQALDDAWANPAGTRCAVDRARRVFEAAGAADALDLIERSGPHPQTPGDGMVAVDAAARLASRACG